MDKIKRILVTSIVCIIGCTQLTRCQMILPPPEFYVEICHPENKYDITPIFDTIKTLEGIPAGLPYGSSSGRWGNSGSVWTAQRGTPIGTDIIYYSGYEGTDVFYHLNIDFPLATIKEYMKRAYSRVDDKSGETKEYKLLGRGYQSSGGDAYDSFSKLIFGFAPKGMVVVWLNFGTTRIELGRYQAQIITDKVLIEKARNKYISTYRITKEYYKEEAKKYFLVDASPERWDNYRNRYNWRPVVSADNPNFELIQIVNTCFNGEIEYMLRPWVENLPYKERAVPDEINVVWLTGKNDAEKKQAYIYFNWKKANETFKDIDTKIDMQIKIAKNNSIEILLNGQPFEADSIRVFDWSPSMLDLDMYKNVK